MKPRGGRVDRGGEVVSLVRCVVRVVDGYVVVEAAAKTEHDLALLRRVILSSLSTALGGEERDGD